MDEAVIIVCHGSRKKDIEGIEVIAGRLHEMMHGECSDLCVRVAYLQFMKPTVSKAIGDVVTAGVQRVIIHPFFLSTGMHVSGNIPAIIEKARKSHPGVEFIYTEPLGAHEKLAEIVFERIRGSSQDPE